MEALAVRVRDPSTGETYEVDPPRARIARRGEAAASPTVPMEPIGRHPRAVLVDGVRRGEAHGWVDVWEILAALGMDGISAARSIIHCTIYTDRYEFTTEAAKRAPQTRRNHE